MENIRETLKNIDDINIISNARKATIGIPVQDWHGTLYRCELSKTENLEISVLKMSETGFRHWANVIEIKPNFIVAYTTIVSSSAQFKIKFEDIDFII